MPSHILSYPDFLSLMQVSSRLYLDYLNTSKTGGLKLISVRSVHPGKFSGEFYLVTGERVVPSDTTQVWVKGKYDERIKITTVLTPRRGEYAVKILAEKYSAHEFQQLSPDDIKLVSDMRFLITRLERFYSSSCYSLFPSKPEPLPDLPAEMISCLSDEQLAAVNGVFESPVSYVNGAPGTGKTNMVLSRCVLRYVLAGKRVFLLAPTNNAVEQMLRGILPVLSEFHIPLTRVYRLGTSTEEFASQYPQVIGDSAADIVREGLLNQRQYVLDQLKDADTLLREYHSVKSRTDSCRSAHSKVLSLFLELQNNDALLDVLSPSANSVYMEYTYLHNLLSESSDILSDTKEKLFLLQRTFSNNAKALRRARLFFWKKAECEQLIAKGMELMQQLSNCEEDYNILSEKHASLLRQCDLISNYLYDFYFDADDISSKTTQIIAEIMAVSCSDSGYTSLLCTSVSSGSRDFSQLNNYIKSLEDDVRRYRDQLDSISVQNIRASLDDIDRQLQDICGTAKQQQKDTALILAGTIDASLREFTSAELKRQIPVSHVFLDEAGYTSLARAMAAFSRGAPVTFLGDHRQLPPVCEMNNISPDNAPVCLWSLSAAYYSELVFGSLDFLYEKTYLASEDPSFYRVSLFNLNKSYRFGTLLADVLALHIYTSAFHGIDDSNFEVLIMDAPSGQSPMSRSSLSEANAIRTYLENHPMENIAILSPYTNQTKLLKKIVPNEYRDSVLTVHRAQGREWDTVVLSVVDSSNPYFVNSKIPIGRSVLCTAISRAKSRLVLVCDVYQWSKKRSQIIAELISCGHSILSCEELPFFMDDLC